MKRKLAILTVTGMLFVMFFTAFLTTNIQTLNGEDSGKSAQTSVDFEILDGEGGGVLDVVVAGNVSDE